MMVKGKKEQQIVAQELLSNINKRVIKFKRKMEFEILTLMAGMAAGMAFLL